jgi:hypothetical protein
MVPFLMVQHAEKVQGIGVLLHGAAGRPSHY